MNVKKLGLSILLLPALIFASDSGYGVTMEIPALTISPQSLKDLDKIVEKISKPELINEQDRKMLLGFGEQLKAIRLVDLKEAEPLIVALEKMGQTLKQQSIFDGQQWDKIIANLKQNSVFDAQALERVFDKFLSKLKHATENIHVNVEPRHLEKVAEKLSHIRIDPFKSPFKTVGVAGGCAAMTSIAFSGFSLPALTIGGISAYLIANPEQRQQFRKSSHEFFAEDLHSNKPFLACLGKYIRQGICCSRKREDDDSEPCVAYVPTSEEHVRMLRQLTTAYHEKQS